MGNEVDRTIAKETKEMLDRMWEAGLLKFGMDDSGNLNAIYVDSDGNQRVSQVLDFVADIEVDGVPMSVAFGDTSASGDIIALAVGAGDRVKVYGISISADATLTGDVHGEIGSTQITPKMRNGIVGGVHWLLPVNGNYIHGALGEDVIISNTVAEAISYAIYYEVYTP